MLSLLMAASMLIDLTYPFDDKTLYWPSGEGGFQLKQLAYGPTEAGYFYSAYSFSTPGHRGTHMGAPIHFAEGGATGDRIPPGRLLGPGGVIRVKRQAGQGSDDRGPAP